MAQSQELKQIDQLCCESSSRREGMFANGDCACSAGWEREGQGEWRAGYARMESSNIERKTTAGCNNAV